MRKSSNREMESDVRSKVKGQDGKKMPIKSGSYKRLGGMPKMKPTNEGKIKDHAIDKKPPKKMSTGGNRHKSSKGHEMDSEDMRNMKVKFSGK